MLIENRQYSFRKYTKCRTVTSYDTKCKGHAIITIKNSEYDETKNIFIECSECDQTINKRIILSAKVDLMKEIYKLINQNFMLRI